MAHHRAELVEKAAMRSLKSEELQDVSGGFIILPPLEGGGEGPLPPVEDDGRKKQKGNNGFGNGPADGVPGNSGFEDLTR